MTREEFYNLWAPNGTPWSRWVKPVLFAFMDGLEPSAPAMIRPPSIDGVSALGFPSTAVVVDLPGPESVRTGIELAQLGYRPVPVFNALPRPSPDRLTGGIGNTVVDVEATVCAIVEATRTLSSLSLAWDAPPAFLLDARRAGPRLNPPPRAFDNRSVHFTTDFPSALFLRSQGIRHVVLLDDAEGQPRRDVAHALRAWQEGGINLYGKTPDEAGEPSPLLVAKPSQFGMLWQRALAALGMRRSPFGGFGGIVPEPGSSG